MKDQEPQTTDVDATDPYWQGPFYAIETLEAAEAVPGFSDGHSPRFGSVSARARQLYAVENMRSKDHVAAALLAIFFGIFGLHKFYLGCNQAAFTMLAMTIIGGTVTFGLAALVVAVISLVEGCIYLSKNQTQFEQIYVVNQRDWF